MKTIGYVTAADPFHDRKAWSGTIYKVREAIENAGFNVFWIPVRLSFLHNLYVKISAFRYVTVALCRGIWTMWRSDSVRRG